MKNLIKLFICFFVLFLMLNNSLIVQNSVIYAISLTYTNIIPFLFPFFIISDILKNYGFVHLLVKIFRKPFFYLFNVSPYGCYVFFLSILQGCPGNSKIIKDLLDDDLINEEDANNILVFTQFVSPLFIIGTLSLMFDKKIAFLILISHYVSNILVGFLFKPKNKNINEIKKLQTLPFNKVLIISINKSVSTILLIIGVITTFSVITDLILLFDFNIYFKYILVGVLEITKGIQYINILNIPLLTKYLIVVFFLSFGGISIHMQVFSILDKYNIDYKKYLSSRVIHGIMSILLLLLLMMIDCHLI
ncbi:MAG: hypothetical protein R3Y21_01455 [Mycoplasmatota bacterium]